MPLFQNAQQNLLLQRPLRRADVAWERDAEGQISLSLASPGIGRFFGSRHQQLDAISGRVWELADGTRSVHEIGKALFVEFGERVEPAQDHAASAVRRLHHLQALDLMS